MNIDNALLSPCGLYCGVCGILIAHRENNQKFKERLCAYMEYRLTKYAAKGFPVPGT